MRYIFQLILVVAMFAIWDWGGLPTDMAWTSFAKWYEIMLVGFAAMRIIDMFAKP